MNVPELVASGQRVIEIDLTTQTVEEFRVSQRDRRMYLGGKGLGLKYLYERLKPGTDPFSPDNILVFMMGVCMGTGAPSSTRFSGLTKSPLTGVMIHSSCGGPFGMALKTAGYEGLIITGKANAPIQLEIRSDDVAFVNATALWGMDTYETQDALRLSKNDGALAIGPAGENQVLFANIASGHRYLGRGGMGAVMGSKNLKAIVAHGGIYEIVPSNRHEFNKACKEANQRINDNHYIGTLFRNYGTSSNINLSNEAGILPVNNFQSGSHPQAIEVSGERMSERFDTKQSACWSCTIHCGHKGTYPDGEHKIPEYESNALLGPNTGTFDPVAISEWNELCGRMGIDTMTAGGTISYVMEASEKGYLKSDLRFGSPDGISETLLDIAYKRGMGAELANGSRWLAEKYGGLDFAIQTKSLELAGYDPRGAWGQGLSYAVSNRGACHLSSTVFALETYFGFLNPATTRAKAKFVRFFEDAQAAVNSIHVCLFSVFAYMLEASIVKLSPLCALAFTMQYLPDLSLKMMDCSTVTHLYSAVTGDKLTQKEFLRIGERVHVLERWMNTREGITREDDTLPGRFLMEGREDDPQKLTVPLNLMLDEYYRLRRYDENGTPQHTLLHDLGIEPQPD